MAQIVDAEVLDARPPTRRLKPVLLQNSFCNGFLESSPAANQDEEADAKRCQSMRICSTSVSGSIGLTMTPSAPRRSKSCCT